jgi:peptidoglycan/xylan/chitin deacetylase (PgdA/CDA1 family)
VKVIISHDVDHIRAREHVRDLIVPKFVVRFGIEWLLGYTRWREVVLSGQSLWNGPWQHIEELMDFDEAHGVPSTFFVAVAKGRKLCYSLADAEKWIRRIRGRGFDVGVHGIEYKSKDRAQAELTRFREITGLDLLGVRFHNIGFSPSSVLLSDSDVLSLKRVGYSFSSTTFSDTGPWPSDTFWEFPIHLMDGHIFQVGRPWKNRTPEQARESTVIRLREAAARGVSYFSLLFHDGHFCDYYRDYKEWYMWLIDFLKTAGYQTCSYRRALAELNGDAGPTCLPGLAGRSTRSNEERCT